MADDPVPSRHLIMACVLSDISRVEHLYERFHFTCRTCKSPLPFHDSRIDAYLESWIAGAKTIPPTTQLSTFRCAECDTSTCVGCGEEPKIHENGSYWSPIGVINNCCNLGRLWGVWLILRRFDIEVVKIEGPTKSDSRQLPGLTNPASKPTASKKGHKSPHKPSNQHKPSGIGYADDGDYMMAEDYDSEDAAMLEAFSATQVHPLNTKMLGPPGPKLLSKTTSSGEMHTTDTSSQTVSKPKIPKMPPGYTYFTDEMIWGGPVDSYGMNKDSSKPSATAMDHVATDMKESTTGNNLSPDTDDISDYAAFDYLPQYKPKLNSSGAGAKSSLLDLLRRPRVQEPNMLDSTVSTTVYLLIGFLQKPLLDGEASMLRLSFLLDRLKEMARNDSIDDMTTRQNGYNAMYAFISHLVAVGLPDLVCNNSTAGVGLNGFEVENARLFFRPKPQASRVASWVKCNQNSYDQAVFLMNLAARPNSTHGTESIRLCGTLIRIHKSLLDKNSADPLTSATMSSDSSEGWVNFWKENKLTFTEGVINFHRLFNPRGVHSATPARGRLNTIHKELANMRTSLPEGVFVKVDESRTDVLKVLIVGVEGTPYAGGLFPFDLLLGEDYPVSPPKMSFVLDEVDQNGIGMNPNLHVGGQVCLSLLNTWTGTANEMWQPNKSTILAVLVSVQAMILGALHPWENEPGPEFRAHTTASEEYSLMVQCKTVKYGMISWLKERDNPDRPSHTDIWKDVSAAYWKYNGENVLKNVREWAKKNDRLLNYTPDGYAHAPSQRRAKGKTKAVAGEDLVAALASLVSPDSVDEQAKLKREADSDNVSKSKRRKTSSESKKSALGTNDPLNGRWVYTGNHKMADIREACEELGIRPTNSIQKSIDRLEDEVNSRVAFPEEARKWGNIVGNH